MADTEMNAAAEQNRKWCVWVRPIVCVFMWVFFAPHPQGWVGRVPPEPALPRRNHNRKIMES